MTWVWIIIGLLVVVSLLAAPWGRWSSFVVTTFVISLVAWPWLVVRWVRFASASNTTAERLIWISMLAPFFYAALLIALDYLDVLRVD